MTNILYSTGVILVILWVVGYYGYDAGYLIHLLVIAAVIVFLLLAIRGNRRINKG